MTRLASELASLRDGEAAAAAALSASAARERRAAAAVAAQQVRALGRWRGEVGWGGGSRDAGGCLRVPGRMMIDLPAVAGASNHFVGIFDNGTPSGGDAVAYGYGVLLTSWVFGYAGHESSVPSLRPRAFCAPP